MDMKAFLLSATLMMAMTSCWAAPRLECASLIESVFSTDLHLPPELHVHPEASDVADSFIDIQDAKLTEMKVHVSECSNNKIDGNNMQNVVLDMTFKTARLTSPNVTLSGTLVDHIELRGSGNGDIFIEDLRIMLTGKASAFSILPPKIHFEQLLVDLTLSRWTVELEGMMPGTDLNAVLNEFLSMVGPELFELMEVNLNSDDTLLSIINCIFPTQGTVCSRGSPLRRIEDK